MPNLRRRPSALHLQRLPSNSSLHSFVLGPSPLSSPNLGASFSAPPHTADASTPQLSPTEFRTPPSTPPCSEWNPLAPAINGAGGRRRILRRNSSLSSVSSSVCDDDEERDVEWTEEEKDRLRRTVEIYTAQAAATESPFAGAPPSNLTHVIARHVVNSGGNRVLRSKARAQRESANAAGSESTDGEDAPAPTPWRHGLKSTRATILHLVKEHAQSLEETPRQGDVDATPRKRKPQVVRQGSMDFLPSMRNVGIVARLGSKLHRAEESGPPPSSSSSHPYAQTSRGGRLHRATSLSSIAGSPSRPCPSARTTSSRMARVASDHTSGPQRPRGGPLDFDFDSDSSTSSDLYSHSFTTLSTSASSTSSAASSLFGLSFDTPIKASASGLGSAFDLPLLGGSYPSPVSTRKLKEKSLLEGPGLGGAFGDEGGSSFGGMKTSSPVVVVPRGGGRRGFGGGASFYLGDEDDTMSTDSFASDTSLATTMTDYSSQPSSASSFFRFHNSSEGNMSLSTPSPMSSTFDLNDLSLEGLEEERNREGGVEEGYLKAGMEGGPSREWVGGWGWGAAGEQQ